MTSGGIVAVGDSIINGHGRMAAGVPAQSFAQWLAEAMDLPFTKYARGGASSTVIVDDLLPRVHGLFTVGVLSMGTNDALFGWDAARFRANMEKAAIALTGACERVVVLTVPASAEATQIIHDLAIERGMVVIDGALSGHRLLRPDGIHPNALGYLELADRAATALGAPSPLALAHQRGQGKLGAQYVTEHYRLAVKHTAKRLVRRALSR